MHYYINTIRYTFTNTLSIEKDKYLNPALLQPMICTTYSNYSFHKSAHLQTPASMGEKKLIPQPNSFMGVQLLTKAQRNLPHITNQSFFPLYGSGPKKVSLAPIVSKCNRRVSWGQKTMSLLLRASKGLASGQRLKRVRTSPGGSVSHSRSNIGIIHVHSTRNNTLLSFTQGRKGMLLRNWASAGSLGFKNSRKSTTYASQAAAKSIALKAKQSGCRALHIALTGTGRAKAAVVRTLNQSTLKILSIKECTPAVHNGCRRPKIRRI